MEKTPRYTQRERNMVLGYAAQYKEIIENKRTDAESNRKKDEVWRQIAKEFNARVYHQRSSKQLRQLYKNMKLLLKKDLCGEGKGNRSFMDLLNTISQQESVAQYISEQMSPSGFNDRMKYDDEYDDSKHPSINYDGMDHDVIVIKSEDISDNEQNDDAMDEDDDDCLSPKDIPEVCLEEEDEELFATDLRQQQQQQKNGSTSSTQSSSAQQQQQQSPQSTQQAQQQQTNSQQQPEVTIQNIGGIRVGSIGNIANMKALQSSANASNNNNNNNSLSNALNNSALSITHSATNGPASAVTATAAVQALNLRQGNVEQQLLLNGLGLSAVNPASHHADGQNRMPSLQRGQNQLHHRSSPITQQQQQQQQQQHQNSLTQQLLLNLNGGSAAASSQYNTPTTNKNHYNSNNSHHHHHHQQRQTSTPMSATIQKVGQQNDYFLLGMEERKLKIELLNAQIEYWKKLTKKLDEQPGHSPNPACMCHFPGKPNGVQTPSSTS